MAEMVVGDDDGERMSIRAMVFDLLVKRRAIDADQPVGAILDLPLFSGGALESIQFLKLLLQIEDELGQRLEEHDLDTANFDTVAAIETLMATYRRRGEAAKGGEGPPR